MNGKSVIFLIVTLLHLLVDMNRFFFTYVTIAVTNYQGKIYCSEPSDIRFRRESLDISVGTLEKRYMASYMIWQY